MLHVVFRCCGDRHQVMLAIFTHTCIWNIFQVFGYTPNVVRTRACQRRGRGTVVSSFFRSRLLEFLSCDLQRATRASQGQGMRKWRRKRNDSNHVDLILANISLTDQRYPSLVVPECQKLSSRRDLGGRVRVGNLAVHQP